MTSLDFFKCHLFDGEYDEIEIFQILGWEVKIEKFKDMATCVEALGVESSATR